MLDIVLAVVLITAITYLYCRFALMDAVGESNIVLGMCFFTVVVIVMVTIGRVYGVYK
jgi:hypothetical protein